MKIRHLVLLAIAGLFISMSSYGQLKKTVIDGITSIDGKTFIIAATANEGAIVAVEVAGKTTRDIFNHEMINTAKYRATFESVNITNKAGRYFVIKYGTGQYYSADGKWLTKAEYDIAFELKKTEANPMGDYVKPFKDREKFYVKVTPKDHGTVNLGNDTRWMYKLILVDM